MKALERVWAELRQALGWKEMLALALLGVALGFHLTVIRPMERRKAFLEERLEQLSKRGEEAKQGTIPDGATGRLAAFYRFFSQADPEIDVLARLYEISRNTGVELRVGDYGWYKPEGTRLSRYQITLPVAGNYAQIRAFSENTLLAIPTLSLDKINFRRKRVSDAEVEAEIRMTLYLPTS